MGERARLLLEHRLEGHEEELQRLVDEQTALRRVATLVAAGAGDTIRIIGDWSVEVAPTTLEDRVYSFGGDTITARVVKSGAPARVESVDDLQTEFARARWDELGIQASIGAPIVVDGRVWGVIMASRTTKDDPFAPGAEHRLGDFAALVAQAIANSE